MTGAKLRETTHTVGGLRVLVRVGGPGSGGSMPLVFVHGAVISGRYMTPTARRVAIARRVFVPDLPGFGHSEDPARPLTVPELAATLRDVLDALQIRRAHLLGNSLGAQVIVDFAARWPGRVASLVLVGPTVDREARTRARQLWRLAKDAFLERPSLIPLHLADMVRAGWRFAVSSLDIALDDCIEDKLPRVTAPVLIVCGSRDPLAPREWCRWLVSKARRAQLEVIEGPHALNYSRPGPLAALVMTFLDRVDAAETGEAAAAD